MSDTSVAPVELTEVEKQEKVNADLRAEAKRLRVEREASEAAALEGSKLRRLKAEEAQLTTELAYQERLRKGRESAAPSTPGVTPAEKPVTPPVQPITEDNKGAKAPASGKDK